MINRKAGINLEKAIRKWFPLFLLPTLAAFVLSFVVPFIMGFVLSFCKFRLVTDAEWQGLEGYKYIFEDPKNSFVEAFKFTTTFAIVAVILINVFAFVLANLLTKRLKGTNFFRAIFFMPNLIGGIVLGYTWKILIDGILAVVVEEGVFLSSNATYGFWGLTALMCWQMIGYMMVIYIAGIQNIPLELVEAAKIDGASKGQILKNVTIPMIMPSITICLFLTISNCFKLYDQNLALTGGEPMRQTAMLALDITLTGNNTMSAFMQGVAQSKAVLFFFIVGIISFIQLCATRKREVQS